MKKLYLHTIIYIAQILFSVLFFVGLIGILNEDNTDYSQAAYYAIMGFGLYFMSIKTENDINYKLGK